MIKIIISTMIFTVSFGYVSAVTAVPPGVEIEFNESKMGQVVFSGKLHAEKGLTCDKCHDKIFQQKKVAQIKMTDHPGGKKYCFACHNGNNTFDLCGRCHKLP